MLASAIIQSLSSGLFIYVIFMSMLPEEFKAGKRNGPWVKRKLAAFVAGWTGFGLMIWLIGSHAH